MIQDATGLLLGTRVPIASWFDRGQQQYCARIKRRSGLGVPVGLPSALNRLRMGISNPALDTYKASLRVLEL